MTKSYNSLKDVLDFGKYNEHTVEQVIFYDPKYLLWALKDIDGFSLSEEILNSIKLRIKKSSDFYYEEEEDYENYEELDFVPDDLDLNTAILNTDAQAFDDYMFIKRHFGL